MEETTTTIPLWLFWLTVTWIIYGAKLLTQWLHGEHKDKP